MNRAIGFVSIVAVVLARSGAGAIDQPIPAKVAVVKPNHLAKVVAKNSSRFTLPIPGSGEDPTLNGAQPRIFDTGSGAGDVSYTLDKTGWSGLSSPPGSKGYKYRGSAGSTPLGFSVTTVRVSPN